MRALIQRVSEAKVAISGTICGHIDSGLLIFVAVKHDDCNKDVDYLVQKICGLRIFSDDNGKFNDSLLDTRQAALVISQFTLFAHTAKGRRPAFTTAATPAIARPLYQQFIDKLTQAGIPVQTGRFGADMQVSLTNDGPVTIMLDSEDKYPRHKLA